MALSLEATTAGSATVAYYSRGLRERFRLDLALEPSNSGNAIANNPQTYAEIDYQIHEAKYRARSEAIVRAGSLETNLPGGWPNTLQGPLVWTNTDFGDNESEYVLQLDDKDNLELLEALLHFKGEACSLSALATRKNGRKRASLKWKPLEQGFDGDQVDKDNFPLPNLGERLEKASEDVYDGRGFVIVRGLDPDTFLAEDFAVIYLGVSSYIAERRGKQDQRGSMLSK